MIAKAFILFGVLFSISSKSNATESLHIGSSIINSHVYYIAETLLTVYDDPREGYVFHLGDKKLTTYKDSRGYYVLGQFNHHGMVIESAKYPSSARKNANKIYLTKRTVDEMKRLNYDTVRHLDAEQKMIKEDLSYVYYIAEKRVWIRHNAEEGYVFNWGDIKLTTYRDSKGFYILGYFHPHLITIETRKFPKGFQTNAKKIYLTRRTVDEVKRMEDEAARNLEAERKMIQKDLSYVYYIAERRLRIRYDPQEGFIFHLGNIKYTAYKDGRGFYVLGYWTPVALVIERRKFPAGIPTNVKKIYFTRRTVDEAKKVDDEAAREVWSIVPET